MIAAFGASNAIFSNGWHLYRAVKGGIAGFSRTIAGYRIIGMPQCGQKMRGQSICDRGFLLAEMLTVQCVTYAGQWALQDEGTFTYLIDWVGGWFVGCPAMLQTHRRMAIIVPT